MTYREIELLPDACTLFQSTEWLDRLRWVEMRSPSGLVKYDAMCRAIAAAKSVDEVKKIRDAAAAMRFAARVAKNKDAEADCIVIRMRATRRLDQMRQAQKETVGLAKGGGGKHGRKRVTEKPTLESQGIDKNLANQARVLGKLTDKQFEQTVADARDAVTRAVRTVVRQADISQQREDYTRRSGQGGTVADLHALAATGFQAKVMYADPAWGLETYTGKNRRNSAERRYDLMAVDEIAALPVAQLAAKDCVLFLWSVGPALSGALEVIKAWGFEFKTVAFAWIKTTKNAEGITLDGKGLHWGMCYSRRRALRSAWQRMCIRL
jgi:hypothetical protein